MEYHFLKGKSIASYAVSPSSLPIIIQSNHQAVEFVQFHLPDQIDGENYNYFYGFAEPKSSFSINNTRVYESIPPPPLDVFTCADILLNNSSINCSLYLVMLQSTDAAGNSVSGGSYLGTFYTGWQTICPVDLKNLPGGANGTWLANSGHAGYYKVTLYVANGCGTTRNSSGFIKLNGPPNAATMNLTINNGSGQGSTCMSKVYYSPCETGRWSGNYSIGTTFANNYISSFSRRIDEVNCNTGTVVSLIYEDPIPVVSNDPNAILSGLAFNSLTINGSPGYFVNQVGHCYKMTVTVSNICSSASDWSFFKIVDGSDLLQSVPGTDPSNEITQIQVYPNPVQDQITFSFLMGKDSEVSIDLYDFTGKIVAMPLSKTMLMKGSQQISCSVASLRRGIYYYKIVSSKTVTGKFVKIE